MMSLCDNYVNRSEVCSDALQQQLCTNSLNQNNIISMPDMNAFNNAKPSNADIHVHAHATYDLYMHLVLTTPTQQQLASNSDEIRNHR